MENEIWKEIPGFGGYYEISSLGRVKSWNNGAWGRRKTPIFRNPTPNRYGYLSLLLNDGTDAKPIQKPIHRLVAEVFIPNPCGKPCVNHKDFNRQNNRVENLEWATVAENHAYTIAHGRGFRFPKGELCPNSKFTRSQVADMKRQLMDGKRIEEITAAFSVSRRHLTNIKNGVYWGHVMATEIEMSHG